MEADGDSCTGMFRPGGRQLMVDHKVKFLVLELKRLSMVGISVSKCLCMAVLWDTCACGW